MGLLDDASSALDRNAEVELERRRQAEARQARLLAEGAELAANFVARAQRAGIEPDVELRERVYRETHRREWAQLNSKSGLPHHGAVFVPRSMHKECLRDDVVGHAWMVRPYSSCEALVLSTEGLVVTDAIEVTEETRGGTYPEPLPERFVKEWREYPVASPLSSNLELRDTTSDGTGDSVPIAAAMAGFLRGHGAI